MYYTTHATPRLDLRLLTMDDAAAWEPFCADELALRFLQLPHPGPAENAVYWIERQLGRYRDESFGLFALVERASGKLVGQAGLLVQELEHGTETEISYHLLPAFRGNGFAAEAAIYLKDFAFRNRLATSLISIIDPQNFSSQAVAERNGMRREKEFLFKGRPHFIFRIRQE